jgi:hypothetical protein
MQKININSKPFVVQVALASPIVTGSGYITLDGLLGAAIFSLTGDADAASNDIPLEFSHGVFHGSQAFLQSRHVEYGNVPFVLKMGGSDIEPGAWIPNNPKVKKPYAFRVDNEYVNRIGSRDFINTTHAVWFGCGDIDQVSQLLSQITAIGAKRGQGFGSVALDRDGNFSWVVQEIGVDRSIVLDGQPARPVPMDEWLAMGCDPDVVSGTTAITLPLWRSPKVMCALPATNVMRLSDVLKNTTAPAL